MIYLIDGKVIYNSMNGTLCPKTSSNTENETISLTTISNKILHHLICHHGELVSRNALFDEIWEKEGAVSSSNTLTQYISLLRKLFNNLLGEKEVIITIPRAGYIFSKGVSVEINDSVSRPINYFSIATIVVVAFIIVTSGFIFSDSIQAPITPRKIGQYNDCAVYDISGVKSDDTDKINNEAAMEIIKINRLICTSSTAFYVNAQEMLHLDKPSRILFSSCIEWPDGRDACQNIYYYRWVRQ